MILEGMVIYRMGLRMGFSDGFCKIWVSLLPCCNVNPSSFDLYGYLHSSFIMISLGSRHFSVDTSYSPPQS